MKQNTTAALLFLKFLCPHTHKLGEYCTYDTNPFLLINNIYCDKEKCIYTICWLKKITSNGWMNVKCANRVIYWINIRFYLYGCYLWLLLWHNLFLIRAHVSFDMQISCRWTKFILNESLLLLVMGSIIILLIRMRGIMWKWKCYLP